LLTGWVGDVLDGQAASVLEDWRVALLDGTNGQWDIYRVQLDKQTTLAWAERAYLKTSDLVDQLHYDAEQLAAAGAMALASNKYRESDILAEVRSSEYPAHYGLKLLSAREHIMREQKAIAAEITSSALQFGQWRTMINLVKLLPPDELVVMRNEIGQEIGIKPAIEAIPELERMARKASGRHATDYAQEAMRLVQTHNPRGALQLLERRVEIDDYLPYGAQRKQLDDVQTSAVESLKKLKQAESLVSQAFDLLGSIGDRDGLDAWEKLCEVAPELREVSFVQHATEQIVARIHNDIQQQQAIAQQAFENADFDAALTTLNHVDEMYKGIKLERDLNKLKNNNDDKVMAKLEAIARVRREMLMKREQITQIKERSLDMKSKQNPRILSSHSATGYSLAWSPDSRTLASGSDDNTVRLWDVQSGQLLRILSGHTSSVLSVAWSPDGKTLASTSSDETIRLWDVSDLG